jgi:ribosomal protein L7Ae-like RNA K-turn-binding protein
VLLDESATMQELGRACGIEVGASAVALLRDM